jgi:hypothetical protein
VEVQSLLAAFMPMDEPAIVHRAVAMPELDYA